MNNIAKNGPRSSLASRGVHVQFRVAACLMSFLPILALIYLVLKRPATDDATFRVASILIIVVAGFLLLLGLAILHKYPRDIARTRHYLERIAAGNFPQSIRLSGDENDLHAIEACIRQIVQQTEERIRIIQQQRDEKSIDDRRRIIAEGLGTACHHLGQPAAAVTVLIYLLAKQEMTPEMRAMVDQCQNTIEEMNELLKGLQRMSLYHHDAFASLSELE